MTGQRTRVVHLLDDFGLGGVTKSLDFQSHPGIKAVACCSIQPVKPSLAIAPALDADVIMTHFPPSWATLPFLLSLKLRNPAARLIHVEHSYTASWERLKVRHQLRFRTMLRLAYRLFDQIVAVSHGQAAWLYQEIGVPKATLRVIQPWSGSQGLGNLEPLGAPSSGPLVIGAYGRFCEHKGCDVLIAAMRLLDPSRFTLLLGGFGPDLESLQAAAKGQCNVRFAGRIDDVAGFLRQCDVVALPSRWEAFGQVAAEAKLAGRPILVAAVDGLPEQVGAGGLAADCSTPERLAAALTALATMPLIEMGWAGRANMRNSEPERVKLWRQLYVDMASSPEAPREIARAAQPIRTSAGQNR